MEVAHNVLKNNKDKQLGKLRHKHEIETWLAFAVAMVTTYTSSSQHSAFTFNNEKDFIYLNSRVTDIDLPSIDSFPKSLSPGQSQELHPDLLCGKYGPKQPGHPLLLS